MNKIARGRTADIFTYPEDENIIIKLFKSNFSEDAINQEFQNSKIVYSLGLHTPQPIKLLELDNRKGILFRRVSGDSILSMIRKHPLLLSKYAKVLAALHYKIHSYSEVEGLTHQRKILSDHIKSASALIESERSIIIEYLEKLPHKGNTLCHGDFHPDNVMVGEEKWIIDWMTGMSGNPAGDVARTIIILSTGTMPEGTTIFFKFVASLLRKRLVRGYIRHYIKLSGLDYTDINQWILPVAAARLVEWMPEEEQEQLVKIIKKRMREIS